MFEQFPKFIAKGISFIQPLKPETTERRS